MPRINTLNRLSVASRRLLFGIIILAITISANGQVRYAYMVEQVVDNIYVLKPNINKYRWVTSNIVVVINDHNVLVVDTGLLPSAATEAIKEIKKITSKPVRYIINTHWHGDHWQGNEAFAKEFSEAEFIATEQGLKGMSRNGMVWVEKYYPKHFGNYINSYQKSVEEKKIDDKALSNAELDELKMGLAQMKQDLAELKTLKPKLPSVSFSEKMILTEGNREIQLLYLGIGNTSGDAVIYLPKEKVLITGDLVVHPSPYESGMFSPEWLETSQKLNELDFHYLIPGHGDVQMDHTYLSFLNALFAEIIKQVSAAYLQGHSKYDEIKLIVTHRSVVDQLNTNKDYVPFSNQLESDFVPASVQTAYKRIIQGKQ